MKTLITRRSPAFFLGFVISLASFLLMSAHTAVAAADDAADNTFRSTCASCHGQTGDGNTPVAKALHVPDLHSSAVQSQSDAQLTQIITNGKGSMPSFGNSLSPDQIAALVRHVRSLATQK